MTREDFINSCNIFKRWNYRDCIKAYKDFVARGVYFPKENRKDAITYLRTNGHSMLGMSNEYIEDAIKYDCAEAFVGIMVNMELWR